MPSVASRVASSIVDEFKSQSKKDIGQFAFEISGVRDDFAKTCNGILIFLAITLIFIAAYLLFDKKKIEIAEFNIDLDDNVAFFGFLVGNILYVLQLGAFFKVLVAEKIINWCTTQSYPTRKKDRLFLSHNSLVGYAVGDLLGSQRPWEKWGSIYIHRFFFTAYSLFFYVLLGIFIYRLIRSSIMLSTINGNIIDLAILRVDYIIYAGLLICFNACSSALTFWLMRDLDANDREKIARTVEPS